MALCHRNGADHCCWFNGEVCPFLRDDGPQPMDGVRWVCTLYEELGDWDLVHEDQRYLDVVGPLWRGDETLEGNVMAWLWDEGVRCGNWPNDIRQVRVKGNDPQWKKDQQRWAIGEWQRLQSEPTYQRPAWCCVGNMPQAPA